MQANTDHIQSTHVGSLARPDALREVLRKRHEGEPYDEAEYHRLSKQAVNDIVRAQVKAGIDIVCDGEMSKVSYTSYVLHRFEGMSPGTGKQDRTTYPQQLTPPPDYLEHPDFAAWRAQTFGLSRTSTTRPRTPMSPTLPMRWRPNTRRSRRPASSCRSTRPTSR